MEDKIELRSDTFTRPGPGMLEAMAAAKIGDDVFGEDPATNELQEYCARLFGFEAGLFCTSGTMTNQIAIACHTRPGDEVICDALSHIYLYEGGGIAANSGVSVQLLNGDRGRISAEQIDAVIKPDNVHFPCSSLVSLENTVNKGGGSCYDYQSILEIRALCQAKGLPLHLDGARLFNAMLATNTKPTDFGICFDSISVCLSKGLGAPMGSILLGSEAFIQQARRVRKRWGGGWRQSGFMAAAGMYALRHQVNRLLEDHFHAQEIARMIRKRPEVTEILPVETNIVLFHIDPQWGNAARWVQEAAGKNILCSPAGTHAVRMVTHLNFMLTDLNKFSEKLAVF